MSELANAIERQDINALQKLANEGIKTKNHDLALAALQNILKFFPTLQNAANLANICEISGRPLDALNLYKQMAKAAPGNFQLLTKIGALAGLLKLQEDAIDAYRKALAIRPFAPDVACTLSDIMWSIDEEQAIGLLESHEGRGNVAENVNVLSRLTRMSEWRERQRKGLPIDHALSFDEFPFCFSIRYVERYLAATAAILATDRSNQSYLEAHGMAQLVSGDVAGARTTMAEMARLHPNHPHSSMRFGSEPAAIITWLPKVEIVREVEMRSDPIFFLACDLEYLRLFAGPLMRSIATHYIRGQVHLHVMGSSGVELEAVTLATSVTGLNVRVSWEDCSSVIAAHKINPRDYFGCVRFIRFAEVLEHASQPIWTLDVDALANSDMTPLCRIREDVALRIRPARVEAWHQFSACLVMGAPNDAARRYFNRVSEIISDGLKAPWWGLDQYALYAAWLDLREKDNAPTIKLLGPAEADVNNHEGIIWFTAGKSKHILATQPLTGKEDQGTKRFFSLFSKYK